MEMKTVLIGLIYLVSIGVVTLAFYIIDKILENNKKYKAGQN